MRSRALLLIFALALVTRLIVLAGDPHPLRNSGEAEGHSEAAWNLLHHGKSIYGLSYPQSTRVRVGLNHRLIDPDKDIPAIERGPHTSSPTLVQPEGLSVFMAGVWAITGDEDLGYIQGFQIVADSAMVFLVFWIGMQLFRRRRAALIAAGLYAVFLPIAGVARVVHVDIWGVWTMLFCLALFLKARDSEHWIRWLLVLGVVLGITFYVRPSTPVYPVLFALIAVLPFQGWRRALGFAVIPAAIALVLAFPHFLRLHNQFGAWNPNITGQGLWEGLGDISNPYGFAANDNVIKAKLAQIRPDLAYQSPAWQDLANREAQKAIKAHPFYYLETIGWRVLHETVLLRNDSWLAKPQSPLQYTKATGKSLFSYVEQRPATALAFAIVLVLEPLLFLIALATFVVTWRRYKRDLCALLAFVLCTTAPIALLHFEPRYMLPASPAYLLLTGLAIDLMVERVGARRAQAEVKTSPTLSMT